MAAEKPRIRWYRKLILIGFGLALAAFMIEFAARTFHWTTVPGDAEYRAVSREIGPMLLPYQRYNHWSGTDEFDIDVRLNKLNFRGEDISEEPPDDTHRVLVMGDSYTANWEVELDEQWSARLEAALGQQVDVVNLGFPGFGTDREYLLYRAYGHKLNADVVILVMYVENDVHDNGVALWQNPATLRDVRPYFTLDDSELLVEHRWNYTDKTRSYLNQSFPKNVIGWLNANSLSYRLGRDGVRETWELVFGDSDDTGTELPPTDQLGSANPRKVPPPLEVLFSTPDDQWEDTWALTAALLDAYRDTVETDGVKFIVALIPPHMIVQNENWQYTAAFDRTGRDWDLWYAQNRMLTVLDDLNIDVINPTALFIDFRTETGLNLFYANDKHFNVTGSCLFGIALANGLVEHNFIDADGFPRDPVATCR